METPITKHKSRASLGNTIKRSIRSTRKDPGSAGKKRRVVNATQKNIARALKNGKPVSIESANTSAYEGRITRARNAALNDAFKETPSRMLRQLSKVLSRPPAECQTPRRNSIRAGTQTTPGSVRLTPSSIKRSAKKSNNKSKNAVTTKKQSPQDLLRQLTRAPGFVQEPKEVTVESMGVFVQETDDNAITSIDPNITKNLQENNLMESTELEEQNNVQIQQFVEEIDSMNIELQLHDGMDNSDDEISNYFDQTETMEFTGEVVNNQKMRIEFNEPIQIQPPDENFNIFEDQGFEGNADNSDIVDAFHSPLVESLESQERNDYDDLNMEQECDQELNYSPKNKKIRASKHTGIARLPNSLIKSLFNKCSNFKVSKEAMQAVFDGTQEYFEQISNDLNTYASHANREIIQEKDVHLLMKRQGLITEKSTFESLVEQYLPRELSDEICPYARAGNKVYPPIQLKKKRMKKRDN
ncbi:11767_t:CDS:2 [Funneliformis mosseae]|uniref:11767_t:CDS:1 n=1 Tax=Funneliformis mosseae TaxID=27381 RepID=A0A9N9FS97_FUNMO|nr:11767_t:CDS:2 [Funneliformis mosseae]